MGKIYLDFRFLSARKNDLSNNAQANNLINTNLSVGDFNFTTSNL